MRNITSKLKEYGKELCLKLCNLDEKIIDGGDTHQAICLRSVSRQLKRVAAE